MLRWLTPDYRVAKVEALSLDLLRQWGIDALLLDADCTLKRYRATEVTPEVAAWLGANAYRRDRPVPDFQRLWSADW